MRATYDPATGKLTCASPGTHFGGDIRAEWHPDEVPGSKQGGGSTGSDSSARGIGQSSAESSAGSRSDPDRRAAASSAPEEGRSDPDNQVGSWLDRYRPPSTSRFGVTPFTGQAWLGNAAAKPVSPSRVFPQAGGKIASDASMADSEAAAPLNTGSTVPPTASAQDTPTPAEPLERNLYAYVGNDPTNSVDPSGLSSEGKLDGGGSFQTAQLAPLDRFPFPCRRSSCRELLRTTTSSTRRSGRARRSLVRSAIFSIRSSRTRVLAKRLPREISSQPPRGTYKQRPRQTAMRLLRNGSSRSCSLIPDPISSRMPPGIYTAFRRLEEAVLNPWV